MRSDNQQLRYGLGVVLASTVLIGCKYDVSFRDCEVSCSGANTNCPDGFMCGSEGRCRVTTATASCSDVLSDAHNDVDADPNAITLRQTTNDFIAPGHSRTCQTVGPPTFENSWYRVFSLAEAGITGAFHTTNVTFGIETATPATQVKVTVATYSGATGPTLDVVAITPIAEMSLSLPAIATGQLVVAPVSATIPAGSNLLVEVFAPDYSSDGKTVIIGTTTSSESHPGYWRAPICEVPTPATTNRDGLPNPAFIIEVTGT